MMKTVPLSWDDFRQKYAALMDELLPALRRVDADCVSLRTQSWGILPRFEDSAFIFEPYDEEPLTFRGGEEDSQILVTGVPWGNFPPPPES